MAEQTTTLRVPHLGGINVGHRLSTPTLDGSKPTLVLFNPFTATADYYLPEFKNNALRDALNLVAVEPLGHGHTKALATEQFTYWDSAIMTLQLLDNLGVDKFFALGTSQGGWIATRLALLAPERVLGVIPVGSSMDYESPRSRELGCWDGPAATSGLVTLAGSYAPVNDFEPGDAYYDFLMDIGFGKFEKSTRDFWAKTIRDNYNGDEGKRRICMAAVCLATRDGIRERVPYVKCPVLWFQGSDDVVFSLKMAEEDIKLFTNSVKAELVPCEGGVHFLSHTHADKLHQGILDFVNTWKNGSEQVEQARDSQPGATPTSAAFPQGQGADHDTPNRPGKRRRVALACANCRQRKSRCDGRRPSCSLCTELGCDCVYEQGGVTTNLTVGRSYLDRLERRLSDIEAALERVQDTQATAMTDKRGESQDVAVTENSVSPRASSPSLVYRSNGGLGELDTAEDPIDGMGAIQFADEEDSAYFGPSSNIAFLRHVRLAQARVGDLGQSLLPSPSNPARDVAGGMSVSRPHPVDPGTNAWQSRDRAYGSVNIYTLPSEARTWSLIKEYFQKTGQLLPFVHEESFCATYFEMKKSNFTKARRTWLGLLNIILAMATTLHVDTNISAEKRIEESDVYYQRAHGLCDKESRRNISLELIQYLLVLGQYLQGTQKSVQAWTCHGLAITTALQLGLHSPRTNKGFPAPECEIRNRVWWGCVLLDRTLSMTFGRPAMIHESYLRVGMPTTSLQVVHSPSDTDVPAPYYGPPMDAMFYTATIKLYNVMYRIIDTCYGQNLGAEEYRTDTELFALVLKAEEELEEWKSQLPSLHMRLHENGLAPEDLERMEASNKVAERFVAVLSLRYHNLQILLHRPILERFLEGCGRSSRKNSGESRRKSVKQLGISSVETCVHSAVAIISIVHTVTSLSNASWRRDLLGAWNYSLFYTFNAGLVIFAAMHVARCEIQNDANQLSRWQFVQDALPDFNMAIEALRNLDRGNRVVERCVSYLSQLTLVPISSSMLDGSAIPTPTPFNYHPAAAISDLAALPRQAPMDIDLNEFMLDTDLDLLNMSWVIPSNHHPHHDGGGGVL
ncbi:hypothetical protein QBC46DRAFT_269289 [Diplogelasinospora grovesii]|uniref:Zn(2)-C6 fungal-type domain-containing protein n=1 Tax=Diplogelasinospora grovesii TaxID=303347 RepID=A0AAN6N108_9PEZI|nr:hypothetical protein QBC46DRAFT_269289 [Diplogelasinospora grovesii]